MLTRGMLHSMSAVARPLGDGRLRTPRSAAVAGILFALLYGAGQLLVRVSVPSDASTDHNWLRSGRSTIEVALALVPFAGIAFLWFIGVVRDRIGDHEDKFFGTVFLGSGLLFLAMTFAAAAIVGGMVAAYHAYPDTMVDSGLYSFSRDTMYRITNIYSIRMASVFMISLGTIWLRTRTMPRPLAIVTYVFALVLMVSVSFSLWIVLVFPVWVLVISVFILAASLRREETAQADPG